MIVYYCGSAAPERAEEAVRAAFPPLLAPRSAPEARCRVVAAPAGPVRERTDRLDVSQGKLALGFRTGGVDVHHPLYPALLVCNALYGGTASSRLFMNVREKLSLCYFASSMVDKLKGLMVVSSGVEFENFQVAREEILAQLRQLQAGEFTREELEAGRRALVSSMRTLLDSQGRMEDYWLTGAVAGVEEDPEGLITRLEAVEAEQVTDATRHLELDTVYYLTGKEG